MIQMQTRLKVADNSGAKEVMFIRALGGDVGKIAGIGDIFVGSVKLAEPNAKIKKGDVIQQRGPPQGRFLYPFFGQCRRDHRQGQRTGRHARIRSGGQGAARKKVHENSFTGPRGDLNAKI
jgi:hypothetical protein